MSGDCCSIVQHLGEQLANEVLVIQTVTNATTADDDADTSTRTSTSTSVSPSTVETCQDVLNALSHQTMTLPILQSTRIGVVMGKAAKAFKRQLKKEATITDGEGQAETWNRLWKQSTDLIHTWKAVAAAPTAPAPTSSSSSLPATTVSTNNRPRRAKTVAATPSSSLAKTQPKIKGKGAITPSETPDPPTTVAEYRSRLIQHGKELYKDPPVLPPQSTSDIWVDPINYGEPKRDKRTGALTFTPPSSILLTAKDKPHSNKNENASLKRLYDDFHPNRTPEEILRAGAFGGTYFRAIHSSVTNQKYVPKQVLADTVQPEWIEGLDVATMLTSSTYRNHINKYGVKCGGSLGMWESSGWISSLDPYGWFQWYCRFYQGRRSADDARQISRWAKIAGPKGRFRSQLCNKILLALRGRNIKDTNYHMDASISPVIRQTLLHWGLEITRDVLEVHDARMKS